MADYDTVSEALNELKARGFTTDFNLAFDSIHCRETGTTLSPADFEIVEHYRFEGNTDPSDEAVVYAVQSNDGSMKGVLVSAYGMYSEPIDDRLIQKLRIHQ